MSATSAPPTLPLPLRVAVILLGAQAVALGGLAIFLVYADLTGEPTRTSIAVGVTVFTVIYAALLGLLARGLANRKGGARGPAVALQLLLLAPAYFMITGGLPVPGWLLLIVLGSVIVALMTPTTARALGIPGPSGD